MRTLQKTFEHCINDFVFPVTPINVFLLSKQALCPLLQGNNACF